jgi:hypothetical protein
VRRVDVGGETPWFLAQSVSYKLEADGDGLGTPCFDQCLFICALITRHENITSYLHQLEAANILYVTYSYGQQW